MNPQSPIHPLAYLKAIAGAVISGLGVLYIALSDDRVTAQETVAVAVAALTSFATVWGIPNAPTKETVSKYTETVERSEIPADSVSRETNGAPTPTGPVTLEEPANRPRG